MKSFSLDSPESPSVVQSSVQSIGPAALSGSNIVHPQQAPHSQVLQPGAHELHGQLYAEPRSSQQQRFDGKYHYAHGSQGALHVPGGAGATSSATSSASSSAELLDQQQQQQQQQQYQQQQQVYFTPQQQQQPQANYSYLAPANTTDYSLASGRQVGQRSSTGCVGNGAASAQPGALGGAPQLQQHRHSYHNPSPSYLANQCMDGSASLHPSLGQQSQLYAREHHSAQGPHNFDARHYSSQLNINMSTGANSAGAQGDSSQLGAKHDGRRLVGSSGQLVIGPAKADGGLEAGASLLKAAESNKHDLLRTSQQHQSKPKSDCKCTFCSWTVNVCPPAS